MKELANRGRGTAIINITEFPSILISGNGNKLKKKNVIATETPLIEEAPINPIFFHPPCVYVLMHDNMIIERLMETFFFLDVLNRLHNNDTVDPCVGQKVSARRGGGFAAFNCSSN